jgi:hypothetical protein
MLVVMQQYIINSDRYLQLVIKLRMDDSVKKKVSKLAWIPGNFDLKLSTQYSLNTFKGYRDDLRDLEKKGYISEFQASLNFSPSGGTDYFNPVFTIKVGWLNWFKLKFTTLK